MLSVVRNYIAAGYQPVLLGENTKAPVMKNWPEITVTQRQLREHVGNIGLKTGKHLVVDVDDRDEARDFYNQHKRVLKTVVETRKGAHFWFRTEEAIGNKKHTAGDIRGIGGQVVSPDSMVDGWRYRFLAGHDLAPLQELPVFEHSMVEYITQKFSLTRKQVTNVEGYIAKIQSVEGQNGSGALMRAAYVCRDAGLSEAECTLQLVRWNQTNCFPAWNDAELSRAITNAYKEY